MHGQREQVRIAEALADPGGLPEDVAGRRDVPGRLVLENEREEHVPAFDAVLLALLEQPLRAPAPAGRAAHITAKREARANPERTAQGTRNLAGFRVELMCALETANPLVFVSEQVGRRGEQLEVRRLQPARLIDERELSVSVPQARRAYA